jgi:hypothetical protein
MSSTIGMSESCDRYLGSDRLLTGHGDNRKWRISMLKFTSTHSKEFIDLPKARLIAAAISSLKASPDFL